MYVSERTTIYLLYSEMETEEIYSVSISPPILSRFAIRWSQDDHISILTEKGVHIFELIPSPMSPYSAIKFSRSFIYPPSIFPTQVRTGKMESKIWNMPREELYSFMMEESLTPKISNVKEMAPKVVDLAWSPQNLVHPSKCLLAILTSADAAIVVYKISSEWYLAYDLPSMRCNAVEKEINIAATGSANSLDSSVRLKNSLKALQASCFTWSELFGNFAYLAVAYHNGDIVIYKLFRIINYNEISDPEIIGTIKLKEYVKISALHWITINPVDPEEHLIIVAYFDGRIYGVGINKNGNNFVERRSIDRYHDHKDRIPVGAIETFRRNDSNVKVLISKGTFLLLLSLSVMGKFKDLKYLQLEGFVISGMICISPDYALVTTENGSMFAVDTRKNTLSKVEVNDKLAAQARVRYLGLARSSSSVIFVNLTTPNSIYDHLVIKEPSKMCMFGLKDDEEQWNPALLLNKHECERFERLWDCLEMLRMKATRALEPAKVFPNIPSDLKCLSLKELQVSMWLSIMTEICEKKKVIQGIGSIAGEISEAQPLIFLHTACNYLTRIVGFAKKSTLSEEQRLSINLLRKYLQVYLTEEEKEKSSPVSKRIEDVLKRTSEFESNRSVIENCNLCGETINDLSWKVTKCPQGHLLPRCAITLLQITTAEYSKCPICGLIFHSSVDEEYEETRCLFCDVPALRENRIVYSKYRVTGKKSLSKQSSRVEVSAEDQETETVIEEV